VIFGHEHLALRTLIGGSLVIVALVVIIRSEEPATEVPA